MPAKTPKQANLMQAALHGATFPKAREVRQSMTPSQIKDFAHLGRQPEQTHGKAHPRKP